MINGIVKFASKYVFKIAFATLLSACSAYFSLLLVKNITNYTSAGVASAVDITYGLGLLLGVLVSGAALQIIMAELGSSLVAELRINLSQQLLRLDYQELMTRRSLVFGALASDTSRVAPLVLIAPQAFHSIILSILISIYLLSISLHLFLVFLGCVSLSLLATLVIERRTRKKLDALREEEEALFELYRAISDAKKELTLSNARTGHFFHSKLVPRVRSVQNIMTNVHLGWGLNGTWSTTIMYASSLVTVYVGQVVLGLPATVTLAFVLGAFFLISPLSFLIDTIHQIADGMASLRYLRKVGIELGPRHSIHEALPPRAWSSISVTSVSYSYPAKDHRRKLIGPYDVELRPGEVVFVVGPNGSGKTTFLQILAGLIPPTSGAVKLDGRDISEDLPNYRGLFSAVFPDFFVFEDVIDNLGRDVPDDRARTLLDEFGLSNTLTIENGIFSNLGVSVGQRKRLALLQCILEDRPIIIFDEWAAEQDAYFRRYFYERIVPRLREKGKTVVLSSHDETFFEVADRIITLGA